MKIVMIAMSLRKESFNKKFIQNAHRLLEKKNIEAELLSFNDYPMSVYNADDESSNGIPKSVADLGKKISEADAVIISTPEYNAGMPGPFKNAFDWVSRIRPMPWASKHVLLIGASPGSLGATRGLWHSRIPFETAGSYVYPEMLGLPHANEAFDAEGMLRDAKQNERLEKILNNFVSHLEKFISK